jgi:hypothetical protein
MAALVVILTGLLFGYDQGVISGTLGFMAKVPETKGKSLAQIQQAWAEHHQARQAPKKLSMPPADTRRTPARGPREPSPPAVPEPVRQ